MPRFRLNTLQSPDRLCATVASVAALSHAVFIHDKKLYNFHSNITTLTEKPLVIFATWNKEEIVGATEDWNLESQVPNSWLEAMIMRPEFKLFELHHTSKALLYPLPFSSIFYPIWTLIQMINQTDKQKNLMKHVLLHSGLLHSLDRASSLQFDYQQFLQIH